MANEVIENLFSLSLIAEIFTRIDQSQIFNYLTIVQKIMLIVPFARICPFSRNYGGLENTKDEEYLEVIKMLNIGFYCTTTKNSQEA